MEKLLEVYEKYEGTVEKVKARDAKYRETHKEERNKKAKEYYKRRKEASKVQVTPDIEPPIIKN